MKIAMIGTGWVAGRHLRAMSQEPDIVVVGHVGISSEGVQAATTKWGGRAYQSIDQLVKKEAVDAVWVCVPPGEHGSIEFALLEREIPFFVEKPLSADRRTGEEIAKAIESRKAIVGVGYHWRALDTLPEIRQKLASNPARMVIGQWHDSTPPPVWWRHQETSGGQMVEQATHLVDLARSLVGEGVVKGAVFAQHERPVYPDADVDDVSTALVMFPGAVVGVFTATCVLYNGAAVWLQVTCEGLRITIKQDGVLYEDGENKREVKVSADPFLLEDRAFLRAVREKTPMHLYSSYADALKTHHLCHDMLDASRSTS
ncbi:MAG: Gfo/Idh/MocA family oxidoreductase [Anaerolineae bacterium]|nr:Gfo/Idh/MocA family oxidoreductase [Anaerolineae bacterium]